MTRILVVEDEAAINEIVVRVLTDAVTYVVAAADGKVAQKMIETEPFDIFLRYPYSINDRERTLSVDAGYPPGVDRWRNFYHR